MLTNEDMLMISELLDVKLDAQSKVMDEKHRQLREELCQEMQQMKFELRGEIQEVRHELHGEMSDMRSEINDIRSEINDIHSELGDVHGDINDLKGGLQDVNDEVKCVKLLLENDVQPRISNIESCYVDTYRRYSLGIIDLETMRADIDILKNIVREHSEKLNKAQ